MYIHPNPEHHREVHWPRVNNWQCWLKMKLKQQVIKNNFIHPLLKTWYNKKILDFVGKGYALKAPPPLSLSHFLNHSFSNFTVKQVLLCQQQWDLIRPIITLGFFHHQVTLSATAAEKLRRARGPGPAGGGPHSWQGTCWHSGPFLDHTENYVFRIWQRKVVKLRVVKHNFPPNQIRSQTTKSLFGWHKYGP